MRTIFHKVLIGLLLAVLWVPAASGQTFGDSLISIAAASGGRVGVAFESDGRPPGLPNLHANERFPMMSVFKFPLALYILHQAEKGKLNLDEHLRVQTHPSIRELLIAMIELSDNVACDRLLQRIGGPLKVNGYIHGLGITGIRIAHTEGEMAADTRKVYDNWCTPATMDTLLQRFREGRLLLPAFTDTLIRWMVESKPKPHRLKGLLPAAAAATLAHKPGTSDTDATGLTAATNDVGIITLPDRHRLYISVFISDSRASEAVREDTIARIARLVYDEYSR